MTHPLCMIGLHKVAELPPAARLWQISRTWTPHERETVYLVTYCQRCGKAWGLHT